MQKQRTGDDVVTVREPIGQCIALEEVDFRSTFDRVSAGVLDRHRAEITTSDLEWNSPASRPSPQPDRHIATAGGHVEHANRPVVARSLSFLA